MSNRTLRFAILKACRGLGPVTGLGLSPGKGRDALRWRIAMLEFYHSPGSCSNGILLLLHELGASFDLHLVDVRKGEQRAPAYRQANPKGKVPALGLPGGGVLTEFPAIAVWLAAHHPDAGLWPADRMAQARLVEALDFMIGSVHMRGFTFVKLPQKFLSDPEGQAALRAHGRDEVSRGLDLLSDQMGQGDYLLGEFSIADTALFFLLCWAEEEGFAMPPNLAACLARLRARPACRAAAPMLRRRVSA
ncbi:glutathione S-transferase family protein [Oceanicola sp. S124]|uniref:glutathione S-transferase family protein n=1 Tax=Oceanicola sp. S124 TaxID=1042378 RepID=UPI0002559025|nr:glutathione S-transferase family protein [Oceanicola sp. S124]